MKVGDKIYFVEEKRPYKVRAANDRYLVCTKPYNLKGTVLYTIVDLIEEIRGTENTVFCMGFESDEGCAEALTRLVSGESEISRRNRVPLKMSLLVTGLT